MVNFVLIDFEGAVRVAAFAVCGIFGLINQDVQRIIRLVVTRSFRSAVGIIEWGINAFVELFRIRASSLCSALQILHKTI